MTNRAKPLAIAVTVIAAASLAACSSAVSSSHAAAAVTHPSLPAGCELTLGALPASPPLTQQQSTADMNALFAAAKRTVGTAPAGTKISVLTVRVAEESVIVGEDIMGALPSQSADVRTWTRDADALRAYCQA